LWGFKIFGLVCICRIKEVDWIPFLTTQLVDDAASHLRLYRTALTKVKENPNCDLLSVFFDLEASMEKSLCRDMACIDDSHLNGEFIGDI
jgi:sorting nexin-13